MVSQRLRPLPPLSLCPCPWPVGVGGGVGCFLAFCFFPAGAPSRGAPRRLPPTSLGALSSPSQLGDRLASAQQQLAASQLQLAASQQQLVWWVQHNRVLQASLQSVRSGVLQVKASLSGSFTKLVRGCSGLGGTYDRQLQGTVDELDAALPPPVGEAPPPPPADQAAAPP